MIEGLLGVWLAMVVSVFGAFYCLWLLYVEAEYEHAVTYCVRNWALGLDDRCRDHHLGELWR